uniref:Ig-like domain-containing protein n=1 Tax=Chelonoidis abingdonii TaxID=106734 RepID=A0A8C0IRU6_CHEAB
MRGSARKRCPGALLMILVIRVSCQVNVMQSPSSLNGSEGQDSSLTCSYSGTTRNVQWYRQAPGESPTFLGILYRDERATWGLNLRAELRTREKHSYLNITEAQLQDTATYLCAVEAQLVLSKVPKKVRSPFSERSPITTDSCPLDDFVSCLKKASSTSSSWLGVCIDSYHDITLVFYCFYPFSETFNKSLLFPSQPQPKFKHF